MPVYDVAVCWSRWHISHRSDKAGPLPLLLAQVLLSKLTSHLGQALRKRTCAVRCHRQPSLVFINLDAVRSSSAQPLRFKSSVPPPREILIPALDQSLASRSRATRTETGGLLPARVCTVTSAWLEKAVWPRRRNLGFKTIEGTNGVYKSNLVSSRVSQLQQCS